MKRKRENNGRVDEGKDKREREKMHGTVTEGKKQNGNEVHGFSFSPSSSFNVLRGRSTGVYFLLFSFPFLLVRETSKKEKKWTR